MQLHTGWVMMIMMIVTMMIVMSRLLPLLLVVVVSRCEARDLLQGVAHVSGRIAEVSVTGYHPAGVAQTQIYLWSTDLDIPGSDL